MSAPPVATIVLAAGASRRMGADDKLLLPVDEKPMVRHAVDAARAAGLGPIVVVTRPEASQIRAAIGPTGVRWVINEAPDAGIGRSVAAGVADVIGRASAAIVVLGDMPWIRAAHLRTLAGAWRPDVDRAVVPTFGGRWGNPVLWSEAAFEALTGLRGDRGGRDLLRSGAGVRTVEMPDDAILREKTFAARPRLPEAT
jgi:molybdenum cofactor cytidylyltransferase